MLDYRLIKSERQWKSSTGLSAAQFGHLAELFGQTYEFFEGVKLEESAKRLGTELLLSTYADCLFFVLFQLKNGLCYDNLGLLIGTDDSNARRNFEKYLYVLERTLERKGVMPKRNFKNLQEFEDYLQNEKEIIVDGSEQPTQRPKKPQEQQEHYSGKKSVTPTKN
ncbi:MAG: hypothetical protein U0Y10_24220 [Spirosomataceae bacterium]